MACLHARQEQTERRRYAHTKTQTQSCNPVNKKVRSIHKQASKHSLKREARQNEREIVIASKHQAEEHPVENERKYTKEKKRKKEGEREGVMCTHFGTCVHTDKKGQTDRNKHNQ